MATYNWSVPTGKEILGSTKIKEADNKLKDTVDDLTNFVNGTGTHAGQGLTYDLIDRVSNQTITGIKTFNTLNATTINSNLTGNVTGNVAGNSDTATSLATSRTISLTGDVTGSVGFNGTSNVSINATVGNDSHTHEAANIVGLSTLLGAKQDNIVSGTHVKTVNGTNIVGSGNADLPHASTNTYGTIKAYVSGTSLYITL